MKRLFSILAIACIMAFGTANATANAAMTTATTVVLTQEDSNEEAAADAPAEDLGFHQELKKRFIEGGPGFMGIVLLCLISGTGARVQSAQHRATHAFKQHASDRECTS